MTKFVVLSKTNPHLPHDSVELQSPPPEDALNDDVAQRNAERYISQLNNVTQVLKKTKLCR